MVSVRQVKAARALLAWSQEDLAAKSGVSYPTLARLESTDGELGGRSATTGKIKDTLESAGVIFVEENGEGPGVRLNKQNFKNSQLRAAIEKILARATDGARMRDEEIRATPRAQHMAREDVLADTYVLLQARARQLIQDGFAKADDFAPWF